MNYRNYLRILLLTGIFFSNLTALNSGAFAAEPIAESESSSTEKTSWGWYYNQTIATINEFGKKNNSRPIALVPTARLKANRVTTFCMLPTRARIKLSNGWL